jgi:hypothetical protein
MPTATEEELQEAEENFWQFILALYEVNKRMKEENHLS